MDLYQALQGILTKINDGVTEARYSKDEKEMLKVVLDNQTRLGEAILILGGLMKAILADDVEVQVMPTKHDTKH